MKYTHTYVDFIRSFTNQIFTKSHSNKEHKYMIMSCFNYLMEIIKISNYEYDNIWRCPDITDDEAFVSFVSHNHDMNELERTVVSFIENQKDLMNSTNRDECV